MKLVFRIFVLVCFAIASAMATTYVAVVETVSSQDVLSRDERNFVTDRLRERAKKSLPGYLGYVIMTRENINAMLPPGKAIEDCEGSCLVETGKNINADYIAQARVGKFGESFTITVEFYETKSNKLVDSFTAREKKIDGLLDAVDNKADSLFARILQPVSIIQSSSSSVVPTKKEENIPSVEIGDQVWMAKNLNVKTQNSWCYDNKAENCEKYGRLYTWYAAKKACPDGWHLPSNKEWEKLFTVVGGTGSAGKKLKSMSEWKYGGNGADAYDFTVFPAGRFDRSNVSFSSIGYNSYFWSSTEYNDSYAYDVDFYYNYSMVRENNFHKEQGFSVRCIKDSN